MNEIIIRKLDENTDSISEITKMLNNAYSKWAKIGIVFVASWQDENITRRRLSDGISFVAVLENTIVGTITVYKHKAESQVSLYCQKDVFYFGQFGVAEDCQGKGLGKLLYLEVEKHCRSVNAIALALDTAETATDLIEMYERWGFRIVEKTKWSSVPHYSVIMKKDLEPEFNSL